MSRLILFIMLLGRHIHAFSSSAVSVPRGCSKLPLRVSSPRLNLNDDDLTKSLIKRISGLSSGADSKPMGPDDVLADKMNVRDIVKYIMDAFTPNDVFGSVVPTDEAASSYEGCRVLMSFAAKQESRLDSLKQLQPGSFESPSALEEYLSSDDYYRAFVELSEWKAVAAPEERGRAGVVGWTASQKLLLRREHGNWEQAYINLQLCDTPIGRRWLVMSIYKHDFDGCR